MSVLREGANRPDLPQTPSLRYLRRYLDGERLTQRQAILSKCCECCGYYVDGRKGCGVADCPLFPYMPYRSGIPAPDASHARVLVGKLSALQAGE